MNDKEMQASEIKRIITPTLLDFPNVVGVGIGKKNGNGEPCITAMVSNKLPVAALSVNDTIPKEIAKVPTDVMQVGQVEFLLDITRLQQERLEA
jgi:hypothetical protein